MGGRRSTERLSGRFCSRIFRWDLPGEVPAHRRRRVPPFVSDMGTHDAPQRFRSEIGMRPTELRPDRRSFVTGLVALIGAGAASHSVRQTPAAAPQTIKPIDLVFASALDAARAIRRKQV